MRELAGLFISRGDALADRVVVYIDWQNTYRGARETFCAKDTFHTEGQIDPVKLAELLCVRGSTDGTQRELSQVRVYTGRPDSSRDSKGYGANQRQMAAWQKAGAMVIARTLRYPPGYPRVKAQEKGIDVALAIDFVMGAIDSRYDVGIIVSTDTDLRPALEVVAQRFSGRPKPETAAWTGRGANRALTVPGARVWSHRLDKADYESVHDSTDYNIGRVDPPEVGPSIGNRPRNYRAD